MAHKILSVNIGVAITNNPRMKLNLTTRRKISTGIVRWEKE